MKTGGLVGVNDSSVTRVLGRDELRRMYIVHCAGLSDGGRMDHMKVLKLASDEFVFTRCLPRSFVEYLCSMLVIPRL